MKSRYEFTENFRNNGVEKGALMKTKKKLPLNHKWRCDKIGSRVGNPSAREKALAEVKRRAKAFNATIVTRKGSKAKAFLKEHNAKYNQYNFERFLRTLTD